MAKDKKQALIVIKRIEGGSHGGHGGAWKVAYADFVTAMMCFFLVMWLMGSDEEVKAVVEQFFINSSSTQNIDMDDKSVKFVGGKDGDGDSMLAGLNGQFPDEMVKVPRVPFSQPQDPRPDYAEDLKNVSRMVTQTEEVQLQGMKFMLPEDLLFERGSLNFKPTAFAHLQEVAKIAARFDGKLRIQGYSGPFPKDVDVKTSSYEFTMSRVVSVMAYLIKSKGMAEERIKPAVRTEAENPTRTDRVIAFDFEPAE